MRRSARSGIVLGVLLATLLGAAGELLAQPRRVLVHGSPEMYWIARVEQEPAKVSATEAAALRPHRTVVQARAAMARQWKQIGDLPRQAVSLANLGTQLAVLFESGEWMLLWDGGHSSGMLPQDGAKLVMLASDGQTLWAVGMAGRGRFASTSGATQPAATMPVGVRLLYRLDRGEWTALEPLPDAAQTGELSLAILNTGPMLATLKEGGAIDTFSWDNAANAWSPAGSIAGNADTTRIRLLNGQGAPMLYAGGDNGRGSLYVRGMQWAPGVPLQLPQDAPTTAVNGVATALQSIRLVFVPESGNLKEYSFNRDGSLSGSAELTKPAAPQDANDDGWLPMLALTLLLLVLINTVRRREPVDPEQDDTLRYELASNTSRLLAGIIDGLPMLGGLIYLLATLPPNEVPHSATLPYYIGIGVYILHTLVCEVYFGWTIGKRLVGLRVVMADGSPATRQAMITRNLLRIIDAALLLTVVLILFSPLRQRIGDIAADTVVIQGNPPQPTDETADSDPE